MGKALAICASLGLYLVYAFWSSRPAKSGREEFAVAKRNLGPFLIAAGLSMTFVGGAATVSMSGLGYRYGFQALIDPFSVFAGLLVAAILVIRYRSDAFLTISESLAGAGGRLLWLVAGVSLVFYTLLMAANIVAFTKLVQPFFQLNAPLLSLAAALITASYTLRSGMMSVTRTDALQLIVVMALFVAPCVFLISTQAPVSGSRQLEILPPNIAILLAFTFLLCPVLQDVKLRAQAARSVAAARIGIVAAAVLYLVIVATAVWAGRTMAMAGVAAEDPEAVLGLAFDSTFGELGVIFVIGVVAAILSTLDGFALAAITTAQALPVRRDGAAPSARVVGALIFIVALTIAVAFPQVLALVLLALLIYVSVLVPLSIGRALKIEQGVLFYVGAIFIILAVTAYVVEFEPVPFALLFPGMHVILVSLAALFQRVTRRKHASEG